MMQRLLTVLAVLTFGLVGVAAPGAAAPVHGAGAVGDTDEPDGVERFAFPGSGTADAIAVGAYGIWIVDSTGGQVVRFDPHTDEFAESIPVPDPIDVAWREGYVWVTSGGGVVQIDEKTSTVLGIVSATELGISPGSVAVGDGSVWVVGSANDSVVRINQEDRSIEATIPVGSFPTDIAFDQSGAWVANLDSGTLSNIDQSSNEARTVKSKNLDPGTVTAGATSGVWTEGTKAPASVCRVGKKPALDACAKLDADPVALASGLALVWVAAEKGRVYAVNALRPGSKRSYFTDAKSLGDIATDGSIGWAVDTVAGASAVLRIGA